MQKWQKSFLYVLMYVNNDIINMEKNIQQFVNINYIK